MTKHGGKRNGSGRKTISNAEKLKRVTVTLFQSQIEWLLSRGAELSTQIRQLIDMEKNKNENIDN
jgi:ribosomal protein S16